MDADLDFFPFAPPAPALEFSPFADSSGADFGPLPGRAPRAPFVARRSLADAHRALSAALRANRAYRSEA